MALWWPLATSPQTVQIWFYFGKFLPFHHICQNGYGGDTNSIAMHIKLLQLIIIRIYDEYTVRLRLSKPLF